MSRRHAHPRRPRRGARAHAQPRRPAVRRRRRDRALRADEPAGVGPRPHRGLRGPVARPPPRRRAAAAPRAGRDVRRLRDAARRPRRPRPARPRRGADLPRGGARARARRARPHAAPPRSTRWSSSTSSSTTRRCCRRSSSRGSAPRPASTACSRRSRGRATPGSRPIEVSGGPFLLGAPDDRFGYDNERPRHVVDMRPFLIGRTPVTNATFLTFPRAAATSAASGGRTRAGRGRRTTTSPTQAAGPPGPDGWRQWRVDGWAPLHPDEPVVHVSWFEADAFARSLGARLPTEQEWEKAAAWDQERGHLPPLSVGRAAPPSPATAAPTSTRRASARSRPARCPPAPRPAARSGCSATRGSGPRRTSTAIPASPPHPYREYSEVFFGEDYRVLRGGSWATRSNVATTTFRNWDLPQRRQIFSGVRLAWDV